MSAVAYIALGANVGDREENIRVALEKLKETPGVKYDNMVVGKDAVKLEATKAVMPVSFTADAAGKRTVAGQFAFSVCTEDKCLMEKRDLLLDVTVE